jgi:glycogen phosphorylase
MKATCRFFVSSRVPESLAGLEELAKNWRWSWHSATGDLFARLDPDAWQATGGVPLETLRRASQDRLDAAAHDQRFVTDLAALVAEQRDACAGSRWFQTEKTNSPLQVIAYFSPEFGVSAAMPQYSGGLGILAGDHLKAASDLGIPLVGIGLFYRYGYFRQSLRSDGWQQERFVAQDPTELGLADTGVRISVDFPDATLHAKVWRADVGRTPLYLLDTDIAENAPELRTVADRLYGGDNEHRLRQEILLGIGGVRALQALGIHAQVFHSNEGHAGFLAFERIRQLTGTGLTFDEAVEVGRAGNIFTTHTPVPAGIDRFPRELIARYFESFATLCGTTFDHLFALGQRADEDLDRFNMAAMGLRVAARANGVAALHGEVSRGMFAGLWSGLDHDEVPITSVTNGVHAHTWVGTHFSKVLSSSVGAIWDGATTEEWKGAYNIPSADIRAARAIGRHELVRDVRVRTGRPRVLNDNVLTIGFARRFATYKRAALLLSQPERLLAMLTNAERPVQFVFAGKAHPADDEGKRVIQAVNRFAQLTETHDRFVFVDDYDMDLAKTMYQGCDVWLNNPRRPLEACGTSGMKAALNGALNCSVLDGWWDEAFDGRNGWEIESFEQEHDLDTRDRLEAESLFDVLEDGVIGTYYDGTDKWWDMVRHNWASIGPVFTASRMVRDYTERLYEPAAAQADAFADQNFAIGRQVAAWKAHIAANWAKVTVGEVTVNATAGNHGPAFDVTAKISLGSLAPTDVAVEAIHGPVDSEDVLTSPHATALRAEADGTWRATLAPADNGPYGVTVRVRPVHPALAHPLETGLAAFATSA